MIKCWHENTNCYSKRDKVNFRAAVTSIANKNFQNWTSSTIEKSTTTKSKQHCLQHCCWTTLIYTNRSNQNHIVWFENHFNIQKVSSSLYQQSRCFRVSILDGSSNLKNITDDIFCWHVRNFTYCTIMDI